MSSRSRRTRSAAGSGRTPRIRSGSRCTCSGTGMPSRFPARSRCRSRKSPLGAIRLLDAHHGDPWARAAVERADVVAALETAELRRGVAIVHAAGGDRAARDSRVDASYRRYSSHSRCCPSHRRYSSHRCLFAPVPLSVPPAAPRATAAARPAPAARELPPLLEPLPLPELPPLLGAAVAPTAAASRKHRRRGRFLPPLPVVTPLELPLPVPTPVSRRTWG